jgi:adenine-specific DNA-methyltransferase
VNSSLKISKDLKKDSRDTETQLDKSSADNLGNTLMIGVRGKTQIIQNILHSISIQNVGYKIIDFLSKVEELQRKLFEKKKFVVRAEYFITIDRVSEILWNEVLQNEAQLDEWRQLYGLDLQLTKEFLRKHPYLVVDTCHFSEDFKWRLLAHFDDLDEALDGLLIKSENFQALNLLMERYRGQVKCIYIDPPYNTGSDEFIYKDLYQHSSWLSMMADRLTLVRGWLRENGAIFVSCDDHEVHHLRKIGDSLWQAIGTFVWEKKKKGSHLSPTFRDLTEYILAYTPDLSKIGKLFGEEAYSGKWQYLLNRANAEGELLFPARKVHAELDDGTYPAGTYGDGEMAVQLLDDVSVQDGVIQNQFRMRGRFKWKQETLDEELKRGSIVKLSKNMRPNVLRADQEEKTKRPPSLITKDIAAYEDAFAELSNLFGDVRYPYPKPVGLARFFINAMTYFNPQGIVLDFFAGSGTTAHAVINLNREDGGRRKYILVEMGDYFETVLLKRIKKVVYSDNWKDGKPQKGKGISHFFKYLYLEQYEGTLNNLELTMKQDEHLAMEQFEDESLLRYMLNFEKQGSPSLLNIKQLQDPFNYKIKVCEDNEIREHLMDLVDTFNYLLGIHVKKMRQFQDNGRLYRAVMGEKHGKCIVIVWRSLDKINDETRTLKRDQQFIEHIVIPVLLGTSRKPDRLLTNGSCYVPEAEPIESEFKRLMCTKE